MTKEYYEENADKIKATAKAWTINQRKKLRDMVVGIKAQTKCNECGSTFPWYCMTFGHSDVATMVQKGVSVLTLANEIRKNRVLCSNCRKVDDVNTGRLTERQSMS